MKKIIEIFNKRYPQNYILRKPLIGTLIWFGFSFLFAVVYHPLQSHASLSFNYPVTMGIYLLTSAFFILILIVLIKRIPWYSDKKEWTFLKEITAVICILVGMGVIIYFMGFIMEQPGNRWNAGTFFNSLIIGFLFGIFPFAFFTLGNYRHLLVTDVTKEFEAEAEESSDPQVKEEKIQITSKLKKEDLSFFPHEFIYAESDGNYVVFYLNDDKGTRNKIIRNSIQNIEKQLADIPYFIRTHRAFIVNVRKIRFKKGNALGYRLKLSGIDSEIPVSRQKVTSFDVLLSRYK